MKATGSTKGSFIIATPDLKVNSTGRRNTSMRRWMGGSTARLGRCDDGQAGDAVPGVDRLWRAESIDRCSGPAIARGVASDEAGIEAGVSPAVGTRWFRECGGMPPTSIKEPQFGRYLSFSEREEIAICRA
jgi:hypothetical protein